MKAVLFVLAVAACACCTIRDDEMRLMAQRECPALIDAVNSDKTVKLTESEVQLVLWCESQLREDAR